MDPKALIKDKEYILNRPLEKPQNVIYVHETINYYVFISNNEMISLTPSNVKSQIYANQME